MKKFYFHADRLRRLRPGQVLSLNDNAAPISPTKGRSEFLSELFPDGISEHGLNYLLRRHVGSVFDQRDASALIEAMAEWIRRSRYPSLPSRFQSLFAWRTVEEARHFAQMFVLEQPAGTPIESVIWEVTGSTVFEGDMRRLSLGNCWLDAFLFIDAYWRQEHTEDPRIEVLLSYPIIVLQEMER